MEDEVTVCVPVKTILPHDGLFLLMLSFSLFTMGIQVSVLMVSPLGMNSKCTTPLVSKNKIAMVFLTARARKAFCGLMEPFFLHWADDCLVAGSNT